MFAKGVVRKLRAAAFQGPYPGGRHEWMEKEKDPAWLTVPNPHGGDIDVALLRRLLLMLNPSRGDSGLAGSLSLLALGRREALAEGSTQLAAYGRIGC